MAIHIMLTRHYLPFAVTPKQFLKFERTTVLPGVSIQKYAGQLALSIDTHRNRYPISPGFLPTHLLLIDQTKYFEALDKRLQTEGKTRDHGPQEFIDLNGIKRQVLIALTLLGRLYWDIGGDYTEFITEDEGVNNTSYSPGRIESVSNIIRWSEPNSVFSDVTSAALQKTCLQLDRYYRSGIWWVDRLSIALGYLWSALTTTHPELAFVALCMSLEALVTSTRNEITHILAERCAILARKSVSDRLLLYSEVKTLYNLRSQIVHGDSGPRKRLVTQRELAITAKSSNVPGTDIAKLFALTIDVINGVLAEPDLLNIFHTKQNNEKETKAIDEYFQSAIFR